MSELFYEMGLVGDDYDIMVEIVNQGIDAHLEAITESQFEPTARFIGNVAVARELKCKVTPKDLAVILKRLYEHESEEAEILFYGICDSLNMEDAYFDDDFETLGYWEYETGSFRTGDPKVVIENQLKNSTEHGNIKRGMGIW